MKEEVYRRIVEQISRYKIGKFCPYFDEPLLDPNIFERIEHALSRLDFQILELATNASLLSGALLDDLVRIFSGVPNEIWLSFHGIDKVSHESIMGLDYATCLENIHALIARAQSQNLNLVIRGSGAPRVAGMNLPVWFTEEQFKAFWQEEFSRRGYRRVPRIDYFTYHDRAGAISRNEVNFSVIRESLDDFYCPRIDQWAHFLYTGETTLCCMDYHHGFVFGDITKRTIEEIYKSDEYFNLAQMVTGKCDSSADFICKRCVSPGG